MDPIPETIEAIDEFGPFGDRDLLADLIAMGGRVTELVPDCVGLSLARRDPDVTFTLVASDGVIAGLDALQYLDGGPCVAAVEGEPSLEATWEAELLAEDRWQIFARGASAAGVASTLTLPIVALDVVIGSVNLYASSPDAFTGKYDAVAAIFGAWAPGAVANSDLTFETRRVAEAAPMLLLNETRIQIAVGILASSMDISVEDALARLRDAALEADVSEGALAKILIEQATITRPPQDD